MRRGEQRKATSHTWSPVTINLLTAVPQGLVLLSDSMLTLTNLGTPVVTTFEHADKLIELGVPDVPAAAMISGSGDLNGKLVSALLSRASRAMNTRLNVDHAVVVECVSAEVRTEYEALVLRLRQEQADFNSQLNVLAGINADRSRNGVAALDRVEPRHIFVQGVKDNDAEAFIHVIPPSTNIVVASHFGDLPAATTLSWPGSIVSPVTIPGISWWGSGGTSIGRLLLGFDFPALERRAADEERAAQVGPPLVDPTLQPSTRDSTGQRIARQVLEYARRIVAEVVVPIPIEAMPLQDAIEFTEYLGKVACGYDRFSVGPPAVGGELDVLVLLPSRRQWIRRKSIHSSL
jgi:hypothetical protein